MKKAIVMLMVVLMTAASAGCTGKPSAQDDDICPGKQLGDEGVPTTQVEGFDTTIDMSFNTADTNGNPVTNEAFAGTERGVWLVFWQTDNEKSAAELARLQNMLPIAKENGYKIIGIVMDGEKNAEKARKMTDGLGFTNIIWNDEVASRYDGIANFFSKEYYDANQDLYEQFTVKPELGEPVSTYTNSRGQIQSSCNLVPVSDEKLESMWKDIDGNATYEELQEQNQAALDQ